MRHISNALTIISLLFLVSCQSDKSTRLFDGKTLNGWNGSKEIFKAENGAIVGGSTDKYLDESFYLCTDEKYSNFELTISVKLIDNDKKSNAGISFRAERVEGSNEVGSYQADIGYTTPSIVPHYSYHTPKDTINPFSLWGSLVDECRTDVSRYPKPEWFPVIFLEMPERELIHEIVNHNDWNEITIIAHKKNIEIKINGVTTVKYTEKDDIPGSGYICLQTHSGEPYEVYYKNINLKILD